jgi:hypothetical protein
LNRVIVEEEDRNSRYFHAVANRRGRKIMIHVLDGSECLITDSKGMLKIATNYYKDLFRRKDRPDFRLADNFLSESEKITPIENAML